MELFQYSIEQLKVLPDADMKVCLAQQLSTEASAARVLAYPQVWAVLQERYAVDVAHHEGRDGSVFVEASIRGGFEIEHDLLGVAVMVVVCDYLHAEFL